MISPETGEGESGEILSFKSKKSFFETEIVRQTSKPAGGRKFSYLQEHEVAKLKTEDEKKTADVTTEDLLKNIRDSMGALGINHEAQITNLSKVSESQVTIDKRDLNVREEIEKKEQKSEEQLQQQRRAEALRRARRQSLEEDERRSQLIVNRTQRFRDHSAGAPINPHQSPSHKATRLVGRSSSFNKSSTLPRQPAYQMMASDLMTSSMTSSMSSAMTSGDSCAALLRRGSATLPRRPYQDP